MGRCLTGIRNFVKKYEPWIFTIACLGVILMIVLIPAALPLGEEEGNHFTIFKGE